MQRHISVVVISGYPMPLEEVAIVKLLLGNRITLPKALIEELEWKRWDRIKVFRKGDRVILQRLG